MGYLIAAVLGYLLGTSNMALYLSKIKKVDPRSGGSGNLGASNAMILMGWWAGVLVGLHDIGKSVLAVFLASRMVSLGSITVAALYPVFTLLWGLWRQYNGQTLAVSTAAAALMAILVIWMHRSNIQRLRNGTEYRFGQKKK